MPDDPIARSPTDADGRPRTMAQLAVHEKAAISHRGHAARLLQVWLDGPEGRAALSAG